MAHLLFTLTTENTMSVSRDKQSLIEYNKRQYKKSLKDLQQLIESELRGIDDVDFTASSALPVTSSYTINYGQRLNALMEIDTNI